MMFNAKCQLVAKLFLYLFKREPSGLGKIKVDHRYKNDAPTYDYQEVLPADSREADGSSLEQNDGS